MHNNNNHNDQLHERRKPKPPQQQHDDENVQVLPISPGTGSKMIRRRKRIVRKKKRRPQNNQQLELGLWQSRGLLVFVACMYSSNFASIKYLETVCQGGVKCEHDPAEIAFSRFFVSTVVALPILYANRANVPLILAGLECGVGMTVNYVTQAKSLELIPAGKVCLIGTMSCAVVPFYRMIFMGKPLKTVNLISAVLALLGVAILENLIPIFGGKAKADLSSVGWGDILAMGQPLGFGYVVMRQEYYMAKYAHLPNKKLTFMSATFVCVCVLMLVWVLWDNSGRLPNLGYMLEIKHVMALFWLGVVTSVGANLLTGTALEKASGTDAALIFAMEPIMASLMANWLLGEALSHTTYIGGAVIMLACLYGSLMDKGDDTNDNDDDADDKTKTKKQTARTKTKKKQPYQPKDSILPTITKLHQ